MARRRATLARPPPQVQLRGDADLPLDDAVAYATRSRGTHTRRSDWFVGAYGAALFAVTNSPADQVRPPAQ